MTDLNFIFYRDRGEGTGWHMTLMALGAGREVSAAGSEARRQVMLDPYGRAKSVPETGSRARHAGGAAMAALALDAGTADHIRVLTSRLVSFATEFALYGNIWQQWLTYMLMMHENPFTIACERRAVSRTSTLMKLAEKDFALIREMYAGDFSQVEKETGTDLLSAMTDYRIPYAQDTESAEGRQIRMLTARLSRARDAGDFGSILAQYYAEYGVGIYGLYRAFRMEDDDIVPVRGTQDVRFDDLVGYDQQKKTLCDNTEAFLKGLHANNVLLYGDSGTGKSTSIHALMHDYYAKGLRLVEISKAERRMLPKVLSEIKKRNYRFIIFLDDLSFEENESDYKELKAMLEGALETRSDHVLIYATSNRRHLIRETWRDRNDMEYQEDVHHSDTMEEKLSLASRFGVTIYYSKPDPKEYLVIVKELARREGLKIDEKELEDEARKWELRHGGMSGRTAKQFITWLRK